MEQRYYKQTLDFILKNNPTISELFSFITDELQLSNKKTLYLINMLIDNPLIEYNYETISIKRK